MGEPGSDGLDNPPDNNYFDGQVVSWNKEVDGYEATLGVVKHGLDQQIPTDPGGELIELVEPDGTSVLVIEVLDEQGQSVEEVHRLSGAEQVLLPGGRQIRIKTPADQPDIKYSCVFPGRPIKNT